MNSIVRVLLPLTLIIGMFWYGFVEGHLFKSPYGQFQDKPLPPHDWGFRFEDRSEGSGINHIHESPELGPRKAHMVHAMTVNAAVAAEDIDGDGRIDLLFASLKQGTSPKLYLNKGNFQFEEVGEKWGLHIDPTDRASITGIMVFDFNNDGQKDIYLSRAGCDRLFIREGSGFVDRSKEFKLDQLSCGFTTAVNVLDYDKDGYLDIYLGNFYEMAGEALFEDQTEILLGTRDREGGARNALLKNHGGQYFENVTEQTLTGDMGFPWAIGVADFNRDGWDDIYIANDFGLDKILLNQKGEKFSDETRERLYPQRSRSSMSSAIGDSNGDGKMDVYISHFTKSGFQRGMNNLMTWDEKRFNDMAYQRGADRCDFSWGSTFFDPDLDGRLDVMVVNGFWNDGPRDYWYYWMTVGVIPTIFRKFPEVLPPTYGTHLSGGQRNCLFLNEGKEFLDVAPVVGLEKPTNSRGVIGVDLDNDGDEDLVISNAMGKPSIYENVRHNNHQWIGMKFARRSHKPVFGAQVTVTLENDAKLYRHVIGTNGMSSQSDSSRIVVGLGDKNFKHIEVIWPDGEKQDITQKIKSMKYNEVVYDK